MTISTTTSRAAYAGNGVTTIFSFPYRFLVNGDLEVTLFAADGTSTLKVLTTDYTVLGADDDAGGSVTMLVAPAVGQTLVIRRVVDLTQETDYSSGDSFPAETHERALDKLTMMDQQLQEQVDRAVTVPVDNDTFSGELPMIVASKFLRVNDSATGFDLVAGVDPGELVVSPFIETLFDDADAAAARTTLNAQVAGSYAGSGANSNITSLSGLTTALSVAQGGTGQITAAAAFGALKQAATDSATGVVELSTAGEAPIRSNTGVVLTPATLRDALAAQNDPPIYAVRAWANINGSDGSVRAGGNVASVTKNATGDYTVTFTTAMPDIHYSVNITASPKYSAAYGLAPAVHTVNATGAAQAPVVGSFRMAFRDSSNTGYDPTYIYIQVVC